MAQNQLPFRAPPPVQKHVDPAHCTSHASKSPSAMVGGELGLLANWKLGRYDWPSSQDINIYQPWLFDTTRTSILFPWSLIFFFIFLLSSFLSLLFLEGSRARWSLFGPQWWHGERRGTRNLCFKKWSRGSCPLVRSEVLTWNRFGND